MGGLHRGAPRCAAQCAALALAARQQRVQEQHDSRANQETPPHHLTTALPRHRTTAPPHHRTTAPTRQPNQPSNLPKHLITTAHHTTTRPELSKSDSIAFAIDLIRQSIGSNMTKQYDNFQWMTNGIMP